MAATNIPSSVALKAAPPAGVVEVDRHNDASLGRA